MHKKVIIYGNSILSKMLFYDAMNDPDFVIACFTADKEYIDSHEFMGLPLINAETVTKQYPIEEYEMVAVLGGYSCMRNRQVLFEKAQGKGYPLRNYISKKADIFPGVAMGVNNIIMGPTHIGMNGVMGDNNMIRQNIYLGHDFHLGNHITIAAGCTIGGSCTIKNTSYLGLGATVINNITLEKETLVGAGSVVIRNSEPYSKIVGNPARIIGYHEAEGIQMSVNDG